MRDVFFSRILFWSIIHMLDKENGTLVFDEKQILSYGNRGHRGCLCLLLVKACEWLGTGSEAHPT